MSEETLGSSTNTEAHDWDNNGQEVDRPQWTGQTDKVGEESLDAQDSSESDYGQIGSIESEAITPESGGDAANNTEAVEKEPDESIDQKIELSGEALKQHIDDGWDIKSLLEAGASVNELIGQLTNEQLRKGLQEIFSSGMTFDANILADRVGDSYVDSHWHEFIEAGADVQRIVLTMDRIRLLFGTDWLHEHGYDVDAKELSDKFEPEEIPEFFYKLVRIGADKNYLYSRMRLVDIPGNIGALRSVGIEVNVDELMQKLTPFEIIDTVNYLREYGAEVDIEAILPKLNIWEVEGGRQNLVAAGISSERLDALIAIRAREDLLDMKRKMLADPELTVLGQRVPENVLLRARFEGYAAMNNLVNEVIGINDNGSPTNPYNWIREAQLRYQDRPYNS